MTVNGNNTNGTTNGTAGFHRTNGVSEAGSYIQEPVAIVSMACRLPDECHNPHLFWKFLMEGKIAINTPPGTRYSLNTHYDGSLRAQTMASPGGMFLQGVDPRDIDAQFFKLSGIEATSMDPQQRQLLEVVYEGLENAGVTLSELSDASVGCFVSSFASDYGDIQARDPENRASATVVGVGRAMLSNRLSHFLNIKGPSMTIDTACSGALIGLDLAMRYLQTREISSAIVAGANLYCSPEHVMDHYMGANGAASLSGKCHTFDEKADGYIKAEAVNMVYLKRLNDAIRDKDPIRAIIRGTATNSDGWTAGIASPNPAAQSAAIRQAYKNAGITDLSQTSYVEFHGTGTRAGDSLEANGVASVFMPYRSPEKPLRIGSVKSNIGHSEPAAGLSGLLKTVLSLEKGVIPGNPTFINPSPKIDFKKLRIWASRNATSWPDVPLRRASINSFGYGGSNAHVIIDEAKLLGQNHVSSYMDEDEDDYIIAESVSRPYLLVLSADGEKSLQGQISALDKHLSDPAVSVKMRNLAYTLSEKRSKHYHRGFTVATGVELDLEAFTRGHVREEPPKIGFVFTGQGAQWPEMGKALLETFPLAARTVKHLDDVLRSSYAPPSWTLYDELTGTRSAEHLRLPEISQPLVTALQLAILALFDASGVSVRAVVGHSSGEIAAAVAAGHLTPEQAIKIAYYRGKATSGARYKEPLGMLAAGLGPDAIRPYLDGLSVQVACINSPQSVTLSGKKSELAEVENRLKEDKQFARLLLVDAAYHSRHMALVADDYLDLLEKHVDWPEKPVFRQESAVMFSSTIGKVVTEAPGPGYWVKNMVSPVLFSGAVLDMISQETDGVDYLVEIGPSNALSGPVNQIKKAAASSVEYTSAWKRGSEAVQTLLETAGKLFTVGCPIRLAAFNEDNEPSTPLFISDLPNYSWDHSIKYWHESESSIDWRYRKFIHHDLLGSKILGSPWTRPTWKNVLRLGDVTWIKDHLLGESVIFPAAGYIAMAIEAIYQKSKATGRVAEEVAINQLTYKLRNVSFPRMLTLDDHVGAKILLSLEPCTSTKESWHEFTISSIAKDGSGTIEEHCQGLVSIGEHAKQIATEADVGPLNYAVPGAVWYKAMRDVGYYFGPAFQSCEEIEAKADSRQCRAAIRLGTPESRYPQSRYAMHPAAIDGCLQIATVALNQGHRSDIDTLMPPRLMDDLVIFPQSESDKRGIVASEAIWSGVGRPDDNRRFVSDIRTFAEGSKDMLFHLKGLGYHAINAAASKPHVFTQVVWGEDIDFLTPDQVAAVLKGVPAADDDELALARIAKAVSLVAHKRPSARILEVALDDGPAAGQSLWIDHLRGPAGPIAEGCAYRFSTASQKAGLEAREKYATEGNIEHAVHNGEQPFGVEGVVDKFDVVILKVSHVTTALDEVLEGARTALTQKGCLILVQNTDKSSLNGTNGKAASLNELAPQGLEVIPGIATEGTFNLVYIGVLGEEKAAALGDNKVHLVHFNTLENLTDPINVLNNHGWEVVEHTIPLSNIPSGSTVLVVDEMFSPVLSNLGDDQFTALRELLDRECRLLWVTMGSQMKVTHPELGLMFGAARSLLAEYPTNLILCLDVESNASIASLEAIHTALVHLNSVDNLSRFDSEFVERNGMYHISRVIADNPVNKAERESREGAEIQNGIVYGHESTIRLVSERAGTLDTLVYTEIPDLPPLKDDEVEIEVHAAGMNFKDLANAMGFVPANEHLFGLECTGIVTEIGRDVTTVKPGDRVLMVRRDGGCFANRVRNRWHAVYLLGDSMSFVDGTTFGIAVHTAVYGLVTLANIQRGQSVLIHSASGGVGLAAIDLCKHIGAEIYVTVGTEAKREFLEQNYGVPRERMFSSRSTTFSTELMRATNGRGIDVCLNSLTGDMLHESWRCIAENGSLIEIGKKDLLDRNNLSMEPFNRNCSYRALDLSRKSITDETTREIGEQIMELIRQGHIKPLHICKVFPFEETIEAFRYMQRGRHIGKVVISYEGSRHVKIPFRPTTPQFRLRPDGSYLIAGGFKGLCGSLAVYLARSGAKNLVAISRSGYGDERSKKTVYDCNTLGCNVDLITGDITKIDDVRRAFKNASKPIVGIIQGAMVLRDRMFTTMTPQEFREPIAPKVAGTWNLHKVSLEQSQPLEIFTMFSSVSGLLGQLGQANYAAGNVFLDAFAAYRLQQGLPACSINLGPVEDIGYLKDKDMLSRIFESRGWSPINEALLHRIIRASTLQQTHRLNPESSGQLVTAITPGNPPFDPVHRFSALRPAAGSAGVGLSGNGAASSTTKLAMLKNAAKGDVDRDTLLAVAIELVNTVLMRSLGVGEPLEPTRPLANYGVDSLVAVELRNWVRAELGVEMSALEIVGARTLTMLCETILKKVVG
ncbi:putative polyketide synthase [Hypoxylon crocopeplum]|nr:putative polyketide synthase [Hypoxylon crocopeplum]